MKLGTPACNPFITLNCNLRCPYCITHMHGKDTNHNYMMRGGDDWITALNNLEDVQDYIFNGGEPTLHPEFAKIINSLKSARLVAIGTNLAHKRSFDKILAVKTRDKLVVDVSLHFGADTDKVLHRARLLADFHVDIRIHIVKWPGWGIEAEKMIEKSRALGLNTWELEYLGFHGGKFHAGDNAQQIRVDSCGQDATKTVNCWPTMYRPIAPNGDVYICHRLMYCQDTTGVIGNIFDGVKAADGHVVCDKYGQCNPCDFPRRVETA